MSDKAKVAFLPLKCAMMFAPVLALPNFDLVFTIESDASNEGLKVVLSQQGKPITYSAKP